MWQNQHTNRTFHRESLIALGATPEEIKEFTKLLLKRRERQEELGNALVQPEDMRVEIGNTNSLWMSIFGEIYLRCETEYERMLVAQQMLEELQKNRALTRAALEELVSDSRRAADRRLNEMQREVQVSSLRKLPPYFDVQPDEESVAASRREAARVARQIWRIIHPDVLKHHPALAKLSKQERAYFEDLQRRLSRPRAAERGFDPSQAGFYQRSPVELHRILGEVKAILENPGEDLDLDELIVGDTMAERISWLRSDLVLLEQGTADAQTQLCQLIADPEYAERRYQLVMPEQHDSIKEALREQGDAYRREAERLEAEIAHRLGETRHGGSGADH